MSTVAHSTSTGDDCPRCGATLIPDDGGEHRQHIVLEDLTHSSGSRLETKLCNSCWWEVFEDVRGER